MTQEIALLRFRAAKHHREGDATRMARVATEAGALAQRCIDERQSTFVLRAMSELLSDMDVAIRQMRTGTAVASLALADAAGTIAGENGRMSVAIRMIERNPADTLHGRALSGHVLRTLLELAGTPSTIEEIAERADRTVDAVRDIMVPIHAAGFSTVQIDGAVRRHSLTMKGANPSLFVPIQTA